MSVKKSIKTVSCGITYISRNGSSLLFFCGELNNSMIEGNERVIIREREISTIYNIIEQSNRNLQLKQ
jgi:hypothetical protein